MTIGIQGVGTKPYTGSSRQGSEKRWEASQDNRGSNWKDNTEPSRTGKVHDVPNLTEHIFCISPTKLVVDLMHIEDKRVSHDALVVILWILEADAKLVLIGSSISINIIRLRVVEEMQLIEKNHYGRACLSRFSKLQRENPGRNYFVKFCKRVQRHPIPSDSRRYGLQYHHNEIVDSWHAKAFIYIQVLMFPTK